MRRRIELRAELICLEVVSGRLEAVHGVGINLAVLGKSLDVSTGFSRREGGFGKPCPNGNVRRNRVGQVDIFCTLQGLLVDRPKALVVGCLAFARH